MEFEMTTGDWIMLAIFLAIPILWPIGFIYGLYTLKRNDKTSYSEPYIEGKGDGTEFVKLAIIMSCIAIILGVVLGFTMII